MAASTPKEERAHDRHQTVVYFRVTRAGSGEEFGHVIDISERGLLLLRDTPLEPRQSFDLVVDCGKSILGKSTVRIAGQVRWCRPSVTPAHFDCGVQIKAIDRRDAEILRHLVQHSAFDSVD